MSNFPCLPCGANAGREQGATYAPGANHQVDLCAAGHRKDNTDAAEIRSFRRGGIINRFLMESVAPARYLRITGHAQHGQPMRPSLNLENQMALLWRTFWERSHAA
jgi:hypothetical protein